MNEYDLFARFIIASAVAMGLCSLGLSFVLFGQQRVWFRWLFNTVGLVLAGALVCILLPHYRLPASLAVVALTALSLPTVSRLSVALLRRLIQPRSLGATLLLIAVGLWLYEGWQFDRETFASADAFNEQIAQMTAVDTTQAEEQAVTDAGNVIPLGLPKQAATAAQLAEMEQYSGALAQSQGHRITLNPSSDDSNCHGWVFANGHYHIGGRNVETILLDHAYKQVSQPAVNDLCVYYDSSDAISHTALVQAVLPDSTVLVAGKWGRMGVMLHAVEKSCYGTNYKYFHTQRPTHTLAIETADSTRATTE